jgi:peptidyl-prolyl cis-trans isomerase B (cyclophilin B)
MLIRELSLLLTLVSAPFAAGCGGSAAQQEEPSTTDTATDAQVAVETTPQEDASGEAAAATPQDAPPDPAPAPKEPQEEPKPPAAKSEPATPETETEKPAKEPVDMAIEAIQKFIDESKIDKSKQGWKTALKAPPKVTFDAATEYHWVLDTNHGRITLRLMTDVAPVHCASTIYLSKAGFYDGLSFHRVIPAFMAQGGCPLGTGTGGPGYKYGGEFKPGVSHDRPGLLSMANAGPNTDGSQVFITFVPTPFLDGKHTLFGEVIDGMNVLKELEKRGTPSGATREKLLIEKATIATKPR